jgi:predicted metal-dependent HD superfamily phosphohydrolase
MQSLQERWYGLWDRIDSRGDPGIPLEDLVDRYNEPWRAHHTLAHIEAMFADLDEFQKSEEARFMDADIVQMAIFYHDAVYDLRAKDNEEKSIELFRAVAEWSNFVEDFTEGVAHAILATKHIELPTGFNCRVLCDLDLAILGKPEAIFDEYERRIREEYNWVSEDRFRTGRLAIMEGFLGRPFVYGTQFFRRKYGREARMNLLRSVEQLSVSPESDR